MVQESEGTLPVSGYHDLYTKTWLPDGPPVAKLIHIHGFSDHVNAYYDLFPSLARRGIAVYGLDQRGWGRSVEKPAEKGLTGPTSTVLADIAKFIQAQLPSDVPVFVQGHSMGGQQVAILCSTPEYDELLGQIRGWSLESPFMDFAPEQKPGWLKVNSGKLAAKLLPHMQLVEDLPPENISRDPKVQQDIRDDKLMHNTGTLEGLSGMLDRVDKLTTGKVHLRPAVQSLVLFHGTADKVTSPQASKNWFDRESKGRKDVQYVPYEGFYHVLHGDPGKERFYEEVGDWILARLGEEPKEANKAPAPEDEQPKL